MWGSDTSVAEDSELLLYCLTLKIVTRLRSVIIIIIITITITIYKSTQSNIPEDFNLVYGLCFENLS
jgi:hypothetical protein